MAIKLTQLPKTQFSGLDYSNILDDIVHLVKDNPDYNQNWDDFLSSNAGRMLIELFAYIADQLATRIDWNVNENFIGTATQKKSVMRILKLIGYNFNLPMSSEVAVSVSLDRPVGTFYLSPLYNATVGQISFFTLTAKDKSGTVRSFEAIPYDSTNARFEYKNGLQISSGSASIPNLNHTINFYEGKTVIETFTAQTDNNPIFTLTQNPVTANSVRVYKLEKSGTTTTETELNRVTSFLDPAAQQSTDSLGNSYEIPYMLNVSENDTVTIEFGPTSLLSDPTRRLRIDDQIRIFYRIGGGLNSNITKQSINTTKKLYVNSSNVNITFVNQVAGVNGSDGETPEHAAVYAPLQIRTAKKAVTVDDYSILLNSDSTVLKSKSYGNNNMPSNLYTLYGLYIKPLEVWNFVLKNKSGWDTLIPSRYNDFRWITLRLENRFNGIYAFKQGAFNENTTVTDSDIVTINTAINYDGINTQTFKNFVYITTSSGFVSAITNTNGNINTDFISKISVGEIADNYFRLISDSNFFDEKLEINGGEINGSSPVWQLYQAINSRYLSPNDISGNINMTTNKNIGLGFDNRTPQSALDLSVGSVVPSAVTPAEIATRINSVFTNDANYNNGTSGTTGGYQNLGLSVDSTTYSNLTLNTDYYFRINADLYHFNSGSILNHPTYAEVATFMSEAISFNITGDIVNGQATIGNVDLGRFIDEIKTGMTITGTAVPSLTTVIDVNVIMKTITLSQNVTASATLETFTIYPYNITIEGVSPTQDIRITNPQTSPVGPIWIEDGNYSVSSQNLLTEFVSLGALTNAYPSTVSVADGASGYQDIGITGVITATHGYQTFVTTTSPSASVAGNYSFKLDVDGSAVNSGNDITVTLGTADTLTSIASTVDTAITGYGSNASLDADGKIRITSATTGSSSAILLNAPSSGTSLLTLLDGTDAAIAGEPDGTTGLTNGSTYYFTINNFEFSFVQGSDTTFTTLISTLNTAITGHSYTATKIGTEWNEDIEITSDTTGWVKLSSGITGTDLFSSINNIRRLSAGLVSTVSWTDFVNSVGGGDYSAVAKIVNEVLASSTKEFLVLKSPSKGENISSILFIGPASLSIVYSILGLTLNVAEEKEIYGYNRLTLITNKNLSNYGKFIWENGSFVFDASNETFYINYLSSNTNKINIGTYYNENFSSSDPSYREIGSRIYNTVYDTNTLGIDIENSEFEIRLTKAETNELSIYSINSDWNLVISTPATLTSLTAPETLVDSTHYKINMSVDGIGFVEVDLTGNNGVSINYTITQIVDNINSTMRNDSQYVNNSIYNFFSFASVSTDGTQIILHSAINTNDSAIEFEPPIGIGDALYQVFGLSIADPSYHYTYNAQGDYYIAYDKTGITGDFTFGSDWITGISSSDLANISIGERIMPLSGVLIQSNVLEIDTINFKIRISNTSASTVSNQVFYVTLDLMTLNRISSGGQTSNLPDLNFYLHFVFDKRITSGIFDGETVANVTHSGFINGSLDEDIYNASLENSKIVGLNHVFKQTKFTTFDIIGTIYYDKIYSPADVQQRVEEALTTAFSLEQRDYAEPIARSKVMNIIHQNAGVDYVDISYLGPDATNVSTNELSTLSAGFDEIIILSEKRYLAGEQIHGVNFTYKITGTT